MQRRTKILFSVLGPIAALLVMLGVGYKWHARRARRAWKERALLEIARLADDQNWVGREMALLRSPQSGEEARILAAGWLTDHMILMKNGEWLVYRSHCPKKEPPHNVSDIFIAKGSNGRWYYSTYHFCVGMIVLPAMQGGEQPRDLASFARDYFLREFDGKSNECLSRTVPGT